MLKLMDRYLLRQMADYFLLGVVVFSLVAFFSNAFLTFIQDIQKYGISVGTSLLLIGLRLPQTVAQVLPAGAFLAVLMVFSGMNATFEITAMRMNGIGLHRLARSALLLGLVATVTTYVLNDHIVPWCNQQATLLKEEALRKGKLPFGRESFTFKDFDSDSNLRQIIYVSSYEGRELGPSTFIDLKDPRVMRIIQSRGGTWRPERWEFKGANVYTIFRDSDVLAFNHMRRLVLPNPVSHMDEEQTAEADRMKRTDSLSIDSDTQNFWTLLSRIRDREEVGKRIAKISYVNLWEKLTLPLSCLVLTLTAVPLALTAPRQNAGQGFILALAILFGFYMLRTLTVGLGRAGVLTLGGTLPLPLSLLLAAWLPILITGALGAAMMARKSRVL